LTVIGFLQRRDLPALLVAVFLPLFGVVKAGGGTVPAPAYRELRLAGSSTLNKLKRELGGDGLTLLQKVNRRDLRHMGKGVVLQVPERGVDLLAFSPFPVSVAALNDLKKAILVSLRVQAFAAYENGRQVYWGPVCTGTLKQATPAGLYHANWKARRKVSTINRSWVMPWYVNLHSSMGIAFHQYALPGKPSSYGCIRLLKQDAIWIYGWADPGEPDGGSWAVPKKYGTPVVVFGHYDYDRDPPWIRLAEEPAVADVNRAELSDALARYEWALRTRNLGPSKAAE
jgi:lipoprotein-anchoring transpeptidase ErfK/SrfK